MTNNKDYERGVLDLSLEERGAKIENDWGQRDQGG